MSMLEKMAEAIRAASPRTPHPDVAMHMARAALEAMRTPSMWMCMAHGSKEWEEWTAYDLWQAMIARASSPSIEDTMAAPLPTLVETDEG